MGGGGQSYDQTGGRKGEGISASLEKSGNNKS